MSLHHASRLGLVLSIVALAAGCASTASEDPSSSTENLTSSQADRGCRVFMLNAGIPTHSAVDGDFNTVSTVASRQDASGHAWWPFTADIGLGASVPNGVTVGVAYSSDGQTWNTIEATQPTSSMQGTRVYHLEWGDGVLTTSFGVVLSVHAATIPTPKSAPVTTTPIRFVSLMGYSRT
jgi:hypothetical protein